MNRHALVVGINNYQAERLANLQAPAQDAEAMALLLEKYGDFKVTRLPEAIHRETGSPYVGKTLDLTLAQLEDQLGKLFKPQGRNIPDTALFYFSGHGLRRTSCLEEGFLATSDVYPEARFFGLSLQWLRRLLQSSPVKQQIVWLDCCYSGELLNISEANPGEAGDVRDRCFIAACREFEPAYSDKDSSMLTEKLLAALDPNRCPEPWVTNFSLVDYLDRQFQDPNQRPVFSNFGQSINLTRITRQEVIATPSTPLSEAKNTICPYKGLAYFDCNEEDPKYFFGREELTDKLIDKVRQSNFLALVGVSGSGKSSVLRAGLLHQLKLGRRLGGSHDWEIKIMVPGERPLENLALAFVDSNLQGLDRAEQLEKAERLLKEGADGLRRLIQSSHSPKIVLAMDQFEETFTLCEDLSAREKFIQTAIVGVLDKTADGHAG